MTKEDHDRWEGYYREALERDALARAYKQADAEDAAKEIARDAACWATQDGKHDLCTNCPQDQDGPHCGHCGEPMEEPK